MARSCDGSDCSTSTSTWPRRWAMSRCARERAGAPTVRLGRGPWQLESLWPVTRAPFALMVCDGLVVRELDLARTGTADLLGPGDLIALGQGTENLLGIGGRWHV